MNKLYHLIRPTLLEMLTLGEGSRDIKAESDNQKSGDQKQIKITFKVYQEVPGHKIGT